MTQTHPNLGGKKASLLLQLIAVIIAVTGCTVMWGWIAHNYVIVQIEPQYSSMKFNTAVCFVLAGLAILMIEHGYRRPAAFLALLGLVLPVLTLLEYISTVNFGVDDFFVTPFIEAKVRYVGRMAPNTAMACFLSHLTLLMYAFTSATKRSEQLLLALAGSMIVALGIVPLIGYLAGIESAHTWGDFAGMALHTAICFILLGSGIIASAWKKSPDLPFWLGIPAAIGFFIISISIWLAVRSYEEIRFEQNLQVEANFIAGRVSDRLTAFYAAIDRISNRWMVASGTPRNQWESDAQDYLKGYPFLKTLEWIDPDNNLQWAIPKESNEKLFGTKFNTDADRDALIQKSIGTRAPQVTKAINSPQTGQSIFYMSPLFINDKYDGLIVAAYTLDEMFNKILARDKNGPFYLTVIEDSNTIFTNTPAGFIPMERWQKTAMVKNKDNAWTIAINPTPEMMAGKDSPLQILILLTGLSTSVFATASVLLAIRSRRDAGILRASEERLLKVIDTYAMLASSDFDLQAFMDDVTERMQMLTVATGAVIELIEGDEMVYKATSGTVVAFFGLRLKRAGSLSGLCVEKREIMTSNDTSADPLVNAEACRKIKANSMVVVPLIQRGTVVGVLKVVSTRTFAFTQQDIHTLQLIAGLLGATLGQQIEIEQRQKLEEQLRHMAQNDSLTGLPNRMLFKDRLSHAILNNARNGGTLGVMYMDIDHFKSINDTHGHAHGDALLKQFAARTAAVLRKGDTLARLGGDEFTLIAENLKAGTDAENIAAKIIEASRLPFELPGITLQVTVSIGIAVSSKPEIDADDIVARADETLYEAKRDGRNRFKTKIL